jgi:hypothetical protein
MNMKSNQENSSEDQGYINPEFADLFGFSSEKAEIEHEARMIMFRFLSEMERVAQPKRGLKKRLAAGIGKSSSFITQLFNGDKYVNLITLAKFQKLLGIKFKIIAFQEDEFEHISNSLTCGMIKNVFVVNSYEINSHSASYTQIVNKSASAYT